MTRLVRGADGRMWTLRSRMEWSTPATVDDFERDVSAGWGAALGLLAVLLLLVMLLVSIMLRLGLSCWSLLRSTCFSHRFADVLHMRFQFFFGASHSIAIIAF